jgi:translation initiation factor 1
MVRIVIRSFFGRSFDIMNCFWYLLTFKDCPFVDAAKGDDRGGPVQDGLVHVRIQQRKGRKTWTTIQGLKAEHDLLEAIVKAFKKEFACGVKLTPDPEHGKVLQLQGDQRTKVCAWLSNPKKGLVRADQLKVHGF